jgi:hypothetical protein
MWAWAALLGGLAVVIAADLVSDPPRAMRHDAGRATDEAPLEPRAQRALALARNFAAWHQAAIAVARDLPPPTAETEIAETQIRAVLPGYYVKAGAWRSIVGPHGVRTTDDGNAVSGMVVGGGVLGRFLAAVTGYAGLGGLQLGDSIARTRLGGAQAVASTAATGHGVRISLPEGQTDPADANAP